MGHGWLFWISAVGGLLVALLMISLLDLQQTRALMWTWSVVVLFVVGLAEIAKRE